MYSCSLSTCCFLSKKIVVRDVDVLFFTLIAIISFDVTRFLPAELSTSYQNLHVLQQIFFEEESKSS